VDRLIILGGVPLSGEISVSGAKNAALPLMCAALLTEGELTLSNVPHLRDVSTMVRLLSQMGVEVSLDDRLGLSLRAARLSNPTAPYDLVKTMRASILVLGPLVALRREARVSLPAAPSARARWTCTQGPRALMDLGRALYLGEGEVSGRARLSWTWSR
jgi:UDP-N-acetylglucosamine 1-carboxyvinyltransferase